MRVLGSLATIAAVMMLVGLFLLPGPENVSAGSSCEVTFSGGFGTGIVTYENDTGFGCVGSSSGGLPKTFQVFSGVSGQILGGDSGSCSMRLTPILGSSSTTSTGRFVASCVKQ